MNLLFVSHSEADTIRLGAALAALLAPADLVALHGDLGAGKTRFVRGVARALDIPDHAVSSPTYVIAQEYAPPTPGSPRLVHVDAYRLRGDDELESVRWDRLIAPDDLSHTPPILLVEWAERIEPSLRAWTDRADVTLSHASTRIDDAATEGIGRREIEMILPDAWRTRPGFRALLELATPSDTRPAVRCPVTGKLVPPDSPTYPFFNEKARLADLNKWFTGGYAISREISPDDADE